MLKAGKLQRSSHPGRPAVLVAALAMATMAQAPSARGANILLADNSQVLQAWQQGGGQAPELVQEADGGTTIQWTGGVSLDVYRNDVTGGNQSTPLHDGEFYKLTAQGDVRAAQTSGDMRFLQFSVSHTDDRAALSHAPGSQINMLHMGSTGTGYHLALGDVTAGFSTLGANVGLRGLLVQKQFGQSVLSATAGALTESWEALGRTVDRTRYLRNVYGGKLETPMWDNGRVYLTLQGYEDADGGMASNAQSLALASGRSATAGFAYQRELFSLTGEAGMSRWSEEGRAGEDDRAFIVDASWAFQNAGLRAGHHDIGEYYASLAAQGGNGVKETYLNGNWMARDWLNLSADLRHSENALAGLTVQGVPPANPTSNATETDAVNLSAAITFGPDYPGWNVLLNHTRSNGKNGNGDANENRNYGTTLAYAGQVWNGSVSYLHGRVENATAPASDADTDTVQVNLGRNWTDTAAPEAPAWTFGVNLGLTLQDQSLDAGGGPETSTWQISLTGQHLAWGTLTASYVDSTTSGQPGGGDIAQRSWQLDAVHPLKGQNSVKLYLRNTERSGTTAGADYEEDVLGVQLVLVH